MFEAMIRAQIAHYLAGNVDVRELERSLPDGWDLDQTSATAARRLLLLVMGILAEFNAGVFREEELRKRLAPLGGWASTVHHRAPVKSNTVCRNVAATTRSAGGRTGSQAAPA